MFPIPFNFPFRKKDGSITTMDAAIAGGGTPYSLPTASANTKGGIKIGNNLTMTGEILSANSQLPTITSEDTGKVLTVGEGGELEWDEKGGGVGVISRTDWDLLTTAQKLTYGLIAIVDYDTGYMRGDLVNGSDYIEPPTIVSQRNLTDLKIDTFSSTHFRVSWTNLVSIGGVVVAPPSLPAGINKVKLACLGSVQLGTCTKSAVLPNVISDGTGRIDYGTSGTFNYDPSTKNVFAGSTDGYTGSMILDIVYLST